MQDSFDAVMILGPTASGKTGAALSVASRVPCEIISMDSALVYRGMDIGTAKPTKEELATVPHHLIDIIDPTEIYSAARFVEDTERLVAEIRARGRLPIICGGTMLYAKALVDGLSPVPATDEAVRAEIDKQMKEKGPEAMHAELSEVDPETASRLKTGDTQRISRALEVWTMTGRPLSSFFGEQKGTSLKLARFGLLPSDRAILHKNIEKRFDQMLEGGFLDEVRRLREIPGLTEESTSMRCVGYRQAWDYLEGRCDYKTFRDAGIAATRQLAKRQMTWMRSMEGLNLIDPLTESPDEVLCRCLSL